MAVEDVCWLRAVSNFYMKFGNDLQIDADNTCDDL